MGVAVNLPPIVPGCMVLFMDAFDRWRYSMVVQFNVCETHYEATVIKDQRITTLILWRAEEGNRWRVMLHAA